VHNRNPNHKGEKRGAISATRCDNCKKEGHSRDGCWFLYSHLRPKRKGERGSHNRKRGREGGPREGERKGFAVEMNESDQRGLNGAARSAGEENEPAGSISQVQLSNLITQLNGLLKKSGKWTGNCSSFLSNFNNKNWVINSSATDHMTGNLDLLETKIKAENLSLVTVANGSKVPIDQIGTTTMLSNKISNVLYLPTFASNLISVSKITKELNCNVIFSPENVVFQDRITKKMIGEGSLENGLYILDMSNKALLANNLEQNKLWHWRVEHASDKVLNKMMSVTNLNNSNCDI
jgi:hypothetical protein